MLDEAAIRIGRVRAADPVLRACERDSLFFNAITPPCAMTRRPGRATRLSISLGSHRWRRPRAGVAGWPTRPYQALGSAKSGSLIPTRVRGRREGRSPACCRRSRRRFQQRRQQARDRRTAHDDGPRQPAARADRSRRRRCDLALVRDVRDGAVDLARTAGQSLGRRTGRDARRDRLTRAHPRAAPLVAGAVGKRAVGSPSALPACSRMLRSDCSSARLASQAERVSAIRVSDAPRRPRWASARQSRSRPTQPAAAPSPADHQPFHEAAHTQLPAAPQIAGPAAARPFLASSSTRS